MDWKDINVRKYYRILEILQEEADPISFNVDLIDLIWDINSADIPIPKFSYYLSQLDFISKPYEPKTPKKSYIIGDKEFIPTLDASNITTAQYIDFQELIKRDDHKNLLNVLFIEKGHNYGDVDNAEFLWENLTVDIYSDVMFFFLQLLNNLTVNTLHSSLSKMKKAYRKEKDPQKKEEIMKQMVETKLTLSEINDNEYLG